jgi:hypothetical protein
MRDVHTNPNTVLISFTAEYAAYCTTMATTAAWGGECEVPARTKLVVEHVFTTGVYVADGLGSSVQAPH